MSEKERIMEARRRKLKRVIILGTIVVFLIRRHKRRKDRKNVENQ